MRRKTSKKRNSLGSRSQEDKHYKGGGEGRIDIFWDYEGKKRFWPKRNFFLFSKRKGAREFACLKNGFLRDQGGRGWSSASLGVGGGGG